MLPWFQRTPVIDFDGLSRPQDVRSVLPPEGGVVVGSGVGRVYGCQGRETALCDVCCNEALQLILEMLQVRKLDVHGNERSSATAEKPNHAALALADVQELIKVKSLSAELADQLDESVRGKYRELHRAVETAKKRDAGM